MLRQGNRFSAQQQQQQPAPTQQLAAAMGARPPQQQNATPQGAARQATGIARTFPEWLGPDFMKLYNQHRRTINNNVVGENIRLVNLNHETFVMGPNEQVHTTRMRRKQQFWDQNIFQDILSAQAEPGTSAACLIDNKGKSTNIPVAFANNVSWLEFNPDKNLKDENSYVPKVDASRFVDHAATISQATNGEPLETVPTLEEGVANATAMLNLFQEHIDGKAKIEEEFEFELYTEVFPRCAKAILLWILWLRYPDHFFVLDEKTGVFYRYNKTPEMKAASARGYAQHMEDIKNGRFKYGSPFDTKTMAYWEDEILKKDLPDVLTNRYAKHFVRKDYRTCRIHNTHPDAAANPVRQGAGWGDSINTAGLFSYLDLATFFCQDVAVLKPLLTRLKEEDQVNTLRGIAAPLLFEVSRRVIHDPKYKVTKRGEKLHYNMSTITNISSVVRGQRTFNMPTEQEAARVPDPVFEYFCNKLPSVVIHNIAASLKSYNAMVRATIQCTGTEQWLAQASETEKEEYKLYVDVAAEFFEENCDIAQQASVAARAAMQAAAPTPSASFIALTEQLLPAASTPQQSDAAEHPIARRRRQLGLAPPIASAPAAASYSDSMMMMMGSDARNASARNLESLGIVALQQIQDDLIAEQARTLYVAENDDELLPETDRAQGPHRDQGPHPDLERYQNATYPTLKRPQREVPLVTIESDSEYEWNENDEENDEQEEEQQNPDYALPLVSPPPTPLVGPGTKPRVMMYNDDEDRSVGRTARSNNNDGPKPSNQPE